MAQVERDGKVTKVKNLGWLLRNWKRVERFEVTAYAKEGQESILLDSCPVIW